MLAMAYEILAADLVDHYGYHLSSNTDEVLPKYTGDFLTLRFGDLDGDAYARVEKMAKQLTDTFSEDLTWLLACMDSVSVYPDTQVVAVSQALTSFYVEILPTMLESCTGRAACDAS